LKINIKKEKREPYIYLLAFLVFGVTIAIAGYLYYKNFERNFRTQLENQLTVIADFQVDELVHWRQERIEDADFVLGNEVISENIKTYIKNPNNPDAKKVIQFWMKKMQTGLNYNAVILSDTQLIKKIIIPEVSERPLAFISPNNLDSLKSGKIVFEDFYKDDLQQKIFLKLLIPVLDLNKLVSILGFRIDPEYYIYPLLDNSSSLAKTSKTFIIRREGNQAVYLNDLKSPNNIALNLRLSLDNKNVPAVKAVLGYKGVMQGIDNRGKSVIAYVKKVPDSPWYLVSQIDIEEAYAPVREKLWEIVIFVSGIFIISGMVLGFIFKNHSARLIKERIKSTEALQKLNVAIYNAREVIFLTDIEGTITYINPEFTKVYGYTAEEVIGKSTPRILNSGMFKREDNKALWDALLNKQTIPSVQYFNKRKDGKLIEIEGSANPIINDDGNIIGFLGVQRDITERKRVESERQLIYEITHAITTTSNLDELLKIIHQSLGKVIYSENCFVALHDPNTGLFSFPYWVDKFDPIPEPAAMKKSLSAYVFRTGKPFLLRQEIFHLLEEQLEVELVGTPSPSWIGIPLRTPNRTMGVLVLQHYEEENIYSERDVQFLDSVGSQIALAIERKLAEGAIKRERNFSQEALDSLPGLFYLFDNQGKFLRWNKNFEKMTGYTAEEITNLSPLSLFDEPDKTLIAKSIQETFQIGETDVEAVLVSKDKTKTSFFFTGKLFNFENKECLIGMGIDVTDRKLAEKNLQKERLLFRTVIDNIPDSIYCKDTAGRKTLANVTELRFSGATTEVEILGKTDFDIYPKNLAEGFYADDQLVIQKGQPVINREEFLFDDKGQKQWLMTSKIPLKDNDGNIIGIVGIGHNITDRKNAEEEIKKRNDELSKINAEKDKFFSIIAHDLKSPFLGLLGLSKIMATEDENLSKDEFIAFGKEMNESASNIFKLIENLLEWAQMQKGALNFTPQEIYLNVIVSQNMNIIKQRAEQKGIVISREVPESLKVTADDKMLNTVLRNLLFNAVKFTTRGGNINVRAKTKDNHNIEISVSDTGVGMSEKDAKRMFKMDEKVSSKGTEGEPSTGLGLLLCKEYVEKHGGKIWVESEEGKGSTFYFTIPAGSDS
jgi:PAS domain S-box-containing protein